MATTSTSRPEAPGSIRQLLFRWLLIPLVGLLLLTALLGYPVALIPVTQALDWALMDTAHSMSRLLAVTADRSRVTVTSTDDTILRSDDFDRIYYSVHGADAKLLAGDPALTPPVRGRLDEGGLFYDSVVNGEQVRVFAMAMSRQGIELTIQVAETKVKRTVLTRQILMGVMLIEALLIAIAGVVVWFGIGKGLQPLQRLRADIVARSPRDLRPVPESRVPLEAQPLVHAINQLLEQLSATVHAQERFVANAAHQLRTPLAGLRVQIEYALGQDNPEEWRHALEMLTPVTERTVHLVNQLLTLAKADAGANVNTSMEAIDVSRVVEEVIERWMPQAIAKDVDVGLELERAPAYGNSFLLSELVSNLVDNAITYMRPGGSVTVRTRGSAGATVIEVEDDGPGIPADERENVFSRFYRIPGSPGAGGGLGLSIVREIAQLHGARVDIRTPPGGAGTVVAVIFPEAAV